MAVKEGYLQRLSNNSGHYTPDASSNLTALKHLDKQGVNLDATKVEHIDKGANGDPLAPKEYRARAVLATGDDRKLMDTHQEAFKQIESPDTRLGAMTRRGGFQPFERPQAAEGEPARARPQPGGLQTRGLLGVIAGRRVGSAVPCGRKSRIDCGEPRRGDRSPSCWRI